MTSGEVLFILAFIVLPTAILVSSVWAVIFVRRRPERVVRPNVEEPVITTSQENHISERTAVFATADVHADTSHEDEESQPIEEPDTTPPVDESWERAWQKPALTTADADDERHALVDTDLDAISVPEDQSLPDPADEVVEPLSLQKTDDLDDVVAVVNAIEDERAEESVAGHPAATLDEPGATAEQVEENDVVDQANEEQFLETSELPVVSPAVEPETPEPDRALLDVETEQASTTRPAPSRRRKESVKLLPGDTDASKHRGRKGEPPRLVPQLSRSSRRRDEPLPETPPESELDQETTSGRE
jgi:hypothetical protein